MRTKEEIQNHIDECNSIIKIFMKNVLKKMKQIFSNSNKVEYQDHIIEDDILPLQAMYYSINKLK